MTYSTSELAKLDSPKWFCLKAQPKREHLAAAGLKQVPEIETFAPRIRFRKATRRGPVWFVEALFPGYLFAKFIYRDSHRQVQHSPAVSKIVRFGELVSSIEDEAIASLRNLAQENEVVVVDPQFQPGDEVKVVAESFQGLEAVVTQIMPAKQRVKVLLEFLGRELEAELPVDHVIGLASPRKAPLSGTSES